VLRSRLQASIQSITHHPTAGHPQRHHGNGEDGEASGRQAVMVRQHAPHGSLARPGLVALGHTLAAPAGRMPPSCGMIAASERPIALSPFYTSTGLLHITQVGKAASP